MWTPNEHISTARADHDLLAAVAREVASSDDLQSLSRPLLGLLQQITGLQSVYLTEIDWAAAEQHILFAHNTADGLEIHEGRSVPWRDTLCRRSLDEGRPIVTDVSGHWGDSDAARELGIETYVSVPVRGQEGELFGTLCAASDRRERIDDGTLPIMELFAQLIAYQAQRQRETERARSRAEAAEKNASRFAALSRIGETCSRAEALGAALSEAAAALAHLYPRATVLPLLADTAGEPEQALQTAGPTVRLDRHDALAWIEQCQHEGRLSEGGGWWRAGTQEWRDAGAAVVADPDARELGVACALHNGGVQGALLMQTRTPSAIDEAMPETMVATALHLSLLSARLHLTAQLRASHEALERQALLDPLTGLPNRRRIDDELIRLAALARRRRGLVCIAFIDLDGFKAINDSHGHDAGDRFLIEIARRLRTVTRTEELCGRYGGDEFVILTHLDPPLDEAGPALKARFADALRGRFQLDGFELDYAGPSIGIARQHGPDEPLDTVLARADAAMYAEKRARRG